MVRKLILSLGLLLTSFGVLSTLATPAHAATRSNCAAIVSEFRRQGASPAVAARFGQIAWRESGCSLQCVFDRDDHSCSRLGINMIGKMPRYWGRLCGATSVQATKNMSTDVRCALAAYRAMGFRPWRLH